MNEDYLGKVISMYPFTMNSSDSAAFYYADWRGPWYCEIARKCIPIGNRSRREYPAYARCSLSSSHSDSSSRRGSL